MQKKYSNIIFLFFLIIFSFNIFAHESDNQNWNTLILNHDINNNYFVTAETHLRFGKDISRLSQFLLRAGINYRLDSNSFATLGYDWVNTNKPFATKEQDDHVPWQQYLKSFYLDSFRIIGRSRLEEMFLQSRSDVTFRFRQLFRIEKKILESDSIYFITANEIFLNLNHKGGFNQNRLFLGSGKKINSVSNLELGYQNQYINRKTNNDFMVHMLMVNLILNY